MQYHSEAYGLYRPEFDHDACGIGALANIKGIRTHQMLNDALSVLLNLDHRGGVGLESNTGDGAGILFQLPHRFFRKEAQKCGHLLPDEGDYGVAMLFLPREQDDFDQARALFEQGCADCGLPVLFWREVPVDAHDLGSTARACQPRIWQAFMLRPGTVAAGQDFERALFVARRTIEKRAHEVGLPERSIFYVCSMSARTIVYKGMLVAGQLRTFYLDLNDATIETAIALVHSRYSTNTTPSWERAHPNRFMIHNGEINTLRGNVNWIRARQASLYSPVIAHLDQVLPIIDREGSDSAILDNVLEFLVMNGRPMTRALSMLIPEPWDHNDNLSDRRRAFCSYQSTLTEPWDGPAAIAFTDGRRMGAVLDRNGLRPARYTVTRDDRLVLSSETGVLDIAPDNVLMKGALAGGQMLLVDPDEGRIIWDDELKEGMASEQPFREWLDSTMLRVESLPLPSEPSPADACDPDAGALSPGDTLSSLAARYGLGYEDLVDAVVPMARDGKEPLASMGVDAPLAVLSQRPRRLFDYFKQLFAQVTNPPIDALREKMVTSTVLYLGNHGNLLQDSRANCRLIRLESPILDRDAFTRVRSIDKVGFRVTSLTCAFDRTAGPGALEAELDRLARAAEDAVRAGTNILVLSDRVREGQVPVPSLLSLGAVHHHLIRQNLRTHVDLVVEAGDIASTHDAAMLIGYSASAVYPYLAHAQIRNACARGLLPGIEPAQAIANFNKALTAGVVAIMSKMGISTMQGYHSAQVFEALGLSDEVVSRYFTGTVSRIGGLSVDDLQREACAKYDTAARLAGSAAPDQLANAGLTQWRPDGEDHLIDPPMIFALQTAARTGSREAWDAYTAIVNRPGRAITLRNLLDFDAAGRTPVPLDEVESADDICRRFKTGAMSYGSISREAHECLAVAMNRLHGFSNTGEGGEDVAREVPLAGGDSALSAIKQVASGRFGVTSRYLGSAREIQIKLAQGAKPGEGGHLPGKKVYPWIARTRRSTAGVGLISPPPHHDIYSIEDLAELIYDLKNANPSAAISVKLVSEAGVGTIATGVAKGGAEKILISGHDGGTGAAPRNSIYHAGLPLELGLAETQQTLLANGLRSRVMLEADGKLLTGRDVAIACLLGAEEFGFATGPLIALGCLMQRDCHQDTCPVGVATQSDRLRGHFAGKPEHVVNFMHFIAQDLRVIMAELGFRTIDDMVGHVECLRQVGVPGNAKAATVDLSAVLAPAKLMFGAGIPGAEAPHFLPDMAFAHHLERTLDATLFVPLTQTARETLAPARFRADIANVNRCVGTMLGSTVTKAYPEGMPDGSICIGCSGSGGQSFGAFLPAGVELRIDGDANDYFGKGLSGGTLSVRPPAESSLRADENIVVGNVAFYGATSGRGFVNGLAGQRFAVRNSGATLVVEGVGNHGCEYMTGGVVVVLGEVGQNFAAGMSGGVAFVYDEFETLERNTNLDMVRIETPTPDEIIQIRGLISEHVHHTNSARGIEMLYRFEAVQRRFKKVIPADYERMLTLIAAEEAAGKSHDDALADAFAVMTGRAK
ncbi:MAG: glutamate synthase large subunit [Coriobacteriia bacterium]|nr:glutamate synthase large subunit [Coriobacteriia bacterium]